MLMKHHDIGRDDDDIDIDKDRTEDDDIVIIEQNNQKAPFNLMLQIAYCANLIFKAVAIR